MLTVLAPGVIDAPVKEYTPHEVKRLHPKSMAMVRVNAKKAGDFTVRNDVANLFFNTVLIDFSV